MPTLIALRDKLDEMLHQIRTVGHIQTPIITCPKCGKTGPAAEPRVSVRTMILALARFEIAPRDQAKALEKAWAKYREEHQLGIEGKALSICHRRPMRNLNLGAWGVYGDLSREASKYPVLC